MQHKRSLWLTFFAIAAFISCKQDAEQLQQQPTTDIPVTERACATGYCEFTVIPNINASVEFCGDINPYSGTCSYGCNSGTDVSAAVQLQANIQTAICVLSSGNVCIRNSPTATQDVVLDVYFSGTSIPLNVTIPPGQSRCFHTNSICSATNTGCQ